MVQLDFMAVLQEWPALLRGAGFTLGLSAVSALLGLGLGVACGWARALGPPVLGAAVGVYVELIRNTPFIVQLFFIFFGLPSLGVKLSAELASVLAMVINLGAYAAEIVRAGIQGTPRGQFEAAAALGLPFLLTLRKVILPQAIRIVIPPTTSNCVSMFKDTSLASTVALPELLKEANNAQALYANPSPLIGAALVYIVFLWPMVRLVSVLEKRYKAENAR